MDSETGESKHANASKFLNMYTVRDRDNTFAYIVAAHCADEAIEYINNSRKTEVGDSYANWNKGNTYTTKLTGNVICAEGVLAGFGLNKNSKFRKVVGSKRSQKAYEKRKKRKEEGMRKHKESLANAN